MPLALAQALTLAMKVSAGGVSLQEAKTYKFASETVYDMAGKPLHHLLLVGPETTDFWASLSNPRPTHALYAVGATDKRSFFSFILPAGSFKNLLDTRFKAGSFKRFVSPSAGILYLEDGAGRIWDTATASAVDPEQIRTWREAQRVLFEQRQKDGILDKIKEDWDRLRAEASNKGLSQSGGLPTLDEVTLPDGQLDVPKLITALEAQKAAKGVSASYTNERAWCMGWFCAGMGYASVVRKNRYNGDLANNNLYNPDNPEDCTTATKCQKANDIRSADLGNWQYIPGYPAYRNAPSGGYWGAWDFGAAGLQPLDYVGCGPMSIVRIFSWYATQRNAFGSGPNINFVNGSSAPPASASQVAFQMFEPVYLGTTGSGDVYQPRIARYTDTWYFMGGGMTRDTNMIPGANNWIRDYASAEGKNWEMRGSHKAFVNWVYAGGALTIVGLPIAWIDFSQHTWRVRDIVRGKIGRDNEPVIAMYPTGGYAGLEGHYAMSQAYIVHEGWFSANVLLWITSNSGDPRNASFVNVTDMQAYYSGAYGMFRR